MLAFEGIIVPKGCENFGGLGGILGEGDLDWMECGCCFLFGYRACVAVDGSMGYGGVGYFRLIDTAVEGLVWGIGGCWKGDFNCWRLGDMGGFVEDGLGWVGLCWQLSWLGLWWRDWRMDLGLGFVGEDVE